MGFFKICCFLILIFSCSVPFSFGDSANGLLSIDSLNFLLRDSAFKSLVRARTGVLYKPAVPANFSGIEIAIVRLRSGSFWMRGANFTSFDIPPRVMIKPNEIRFALVYQNLANWSSTYFTIPGYSLVAPVLGFLAYSAPDMNATNIQQIDLHATENPILVRFSGIAMAEGSNPTAKCVRFGTDGSVYFSNMTAPGLCSTTSQGHFSIVVPNTASVTPPIGFRAKKKEVRVLGIAIGCGIFGLILLGLVVMILLRFLKMKKMTEMEDKADQEEYLGSVWVGNSRMPAAVVTRTQPIIENGNPP